MDANRLKFWLLANEGDWRAGPGARYDRARRRLALASERAPRTPPDAPADPRGLAEAALAAPPGSCDPFGTRASLKGGLVVAEGVAAGQVALHWPAGAATLSDIAIGYDDVLYLADDGAVLLYDLRDRWPAEAVRLDGFAAWRLAPRPGGGAYVLGRDGASLAELRGRPLPSQPMAAGLPEAARPCEPNRDPPRIELLPADPAGAVAIACSPSGRLALLAWGDEGQALLRLLGADGSLGGPVVCEDAAFAYSLAWCDDDRPALLSPLAPGEALVYDLREGAASLRPVGDFFPLHGHDGGPLLHGVELPPRYPTAAGPRPLFHLSLPSYAPGGAAAGRPLDSGDAATVWHRLYLEALIPDHCGLRVLLAATDGPAPPADDEALAWHEHRFGPAFAEGQGGLPRGAWVAAPSELPHHPGMLGCPPARERAGLFTALIQRAGRRVRALRGRHLHVRVELIGDERSTPELAAVRAYGSRFSYVERYLPELYHEHSYGPDADAPGGSTPADFLERFLANFEGVLTPLEDRVAAAHLLTDAGAAPAEALEWLGAWIGLSFDPLYPPDRRRDLIRAAPEIFRWRGTARGLTLALDAVTGGGAGRGHVVVVENFRLRRTFATILGADLADEEDPLLAGVARSGNSFVGDTLFLGDEARGEFMALFGPQLADAAEERDALAFFERQAHRVSVLVHRDALQDELPAIRRVVELETPAHVEAQVLAASDQFLVGVAALVGVDSYLARRPRPQPARVDRSLIGVRDRVLGAGALDPRLEGGLAPRNRLPPRALASGPVEAELRRPITLDASGSRAAPGREIVGYVWRRIDPESLDERS